MSTTSLAEVMPLVEKLSPEEKLRLIEHIARALQQNPPPGLRLSWTDARGLGKEIWEGVDVDRYIDELRNEWERWETSSAPPTPSAWTPSSSSTILKSIRVIRHSVRTADERRRAHYPSATERYLAALRKAGLK